MIILDTNVLSEILRPTPEQRVIDWLAAQDGATVYLTAMTEAELRHSVALLPEGKRRGDQTRIIGQIIHEDFTGRVLPFDSPAAEASPHSLSDLSACS
ncbi:PIN domain-containing protein [Paracoccus sp. (in: a-proteobacteria)]|uniref:PIN domain-containing protein n=1 Tax=Paracoccus sp. TaxID=267 RepID=UPI0034CDA7A0